MQTENTLTLLACAGRRLQRPGRAASTCAAAKRRAGDGAPNPDATRTPDPPLTRPALPHAPALDGLRALAVCAVLFYHAGLAWMPGGFLGVEVFFVISGYLITSLLLAEWTTTGRVDLPGFWLRRARRLLPALFALLLVVVAFAVVFLPDEVAGLRGDTVSGMLYVNNWYQIFSHKSYFECAGRPSLLRHLWSLAVEEQFYLIWPLFFCLLMRRPRMALGVVLAVAVAAAGWMAVQYIPDTDPSRIYYGTDTRASGILIGTALAFLRLRVPATAATCGRAWHVAGVIALAVLILCLLRINEFQAFIYCGGFVLASLATAVLIAVSVHAPATRVSRLFAGPLLRWIGVRSYGIYLWHFPVFMVTRPQLDLPLRGAALLALRLTITILIAAVSYRLLELPIRQGVLARSWQAWRAAQGRKRWSGATAVVSLAALFIVFGARLFLAEPPPTPEYLAAMTRPDNATAQPDSSASPAADETRRAEACAPDLPAATETCTAVVAPPPTSTTNAMCGTQIVAIGDSVMLGVRDELRRVLGTNVLVDAAVGRQARHALTLVRKLHEEGMVRPIVVLQIGNNGFFSANLFDQIMAELTQARTVLVVNVRVPRPWETPNNAMLAEAVARYPKAVLLDWHAASENHPEIFWKDGHHLRPKGAVFYTDLIVKTLRRNSTPSAPVAAFDEPGSIAATAP